MSQARRRPRTDAHLEGSNLIKQNRPFHESISEKIAALGTDDHVKLQVYGDLIRDTELKDPKHRTLVAETYRKKVDEIGVHGVFFVSDVDAWERGVPNGGATAEGLEHTDRGSRTSAEGAPDRA